MNKPGLLASCLFALVCVSVGWFWQRQEILRTRAENARLLADAAERDSLREEISRLREWQADPVELDRLRQSQSELLRLRGETSRLRQQLKEAEQPRRSAAVSATAPAATAAVSDEPPVSPVETFSASIRARLTSKQTLVTGGWSTSDGKRTLVLVEAVIGDAGMPGMVTIQARFAEMPEDVLSKTGLDWMKSNARESSTQSILDPEQAAQLVATLESSQGVDIMSVPNVSTLDGRQAQIKTVNLRTFGPGETHELGPVVEVVPHLAADGGSVDLTVIARLKLESTKAR